MNLRPIGKIVRLQIQRTTLSLGERPNRYYDPAGLVSVSELTLTPRGALARLPNGDTSTGSPVPAPQVQAGQVIALDYHHADYPNGGNAEENDLSINFTAHYDAIREKFGNGDHLFNGCGGENILIETGERVSLEMVRGGAVVRTRSGRLAWLRRVMVARPCQPFSQYASRRTEPESIKEALQFLDNGTRGFYCGLEEEEVTVVVGDEVFLHTG
ncbi:MAG TPA: MOSC domain-containing protein [Anaerolineales bacterium]|nr:MOSC domain-containing protein [Anaerolineales bacterium]